MTIRFSGTRDHRDYPHRLEFLDLEDQLKRAGLPTIRQVAYQNSRELRLRFSNSPAKGEELCIPDDTVSLAWLDWPHRHVSLDAKLVFDGLAEALAKCGYEVSSAIRAGGQGTPIAILVKFASTPSVPEWRGRPPGRST